jgi:hypothetical protein
VTNGVRVNRHDFAYRTVALQTVPERVPRKQQQQQQQQQQNNNNNNNKTHSRSM